MTEADYRAFPAVNFSTLKHIAHSPAMYRHVLATPHEDTPAFAFGRAVHCLVLEPQHWDRDFAVFEGARRAGKEWDAFAALTTGKTILKVEEYRQAFDVAASVLAHPVARDLLEHGQAEVCRMWTDATTGLACKGRMDFVGSGYVLDLKTTRSNDPRLFARDVASYQIHAQLAWYRRANPGARCVLVAVEKDAPYDVCVYELDDSALSAGDALCDRWLATLAECLRTDRWPGRSDDLQYLTLPSWAFEVPRD